MASALVSFLDLLKYTWGRAVNWKDRMLRILREDSKGWIICACVLVITVIRSGITYSFGVFVVELEDQYKTPLAEQNWIGTLSFCISLSMAPASVMFIRALKYRGYRWGGIIGTLVLFISCLSSSFAVQEEWLFLTHSILYGVGSSLIYMASSLVIGEYFDKEHKYHVLATSILLCGYPIGSLLFNPINASLVHNFSWRVAFRVSSGMILFTGLVCCWQFSSKSSPNMQRLEEEPETPTETEMVDMVVEEDATMPKRCCTLSEVKERPEIVLWYLGNCLSYLGFYMPFINLAFYMELKHIDTFHSSFALTLLSAAECVTYIVASFMGDYLKGKLVYVNVVSAAALAFICLIWPVIDVSYGVILFIAIMMGGFLGLTIVYTYAASGEVTEQRIDMAWSCTNLWSGIGILIGPFFSGAVYDLRKSYDDVFYVVGCLYIIDALVFGAIVIIKYRRKIREKTDYNEISGILGDKQTFHISARRSVSKSSLVNEDGDGVSDYGTTTTTEPVTRISPEYGNYMNGDSMKSYNHRMAVKTWQ